MALINYHNEHYDQDYYDDEIPENPRRKRGNRTFLRVILVLGFFLVIALLGLLWLAPKVLANQQDANLDQAALINAANTATALALTEGMNLQQTQLASTMQALNLTPMPTSTPVIEVIINEQPRDVAGLSVSDIAVVPAVQAQAEESSAPMPAELPKAGFADGFNLPLMAAAAFILVAIIALSRKFRISSR